MAGRTTIEQLAGAMEALASAAESVGIVPPLGASWVLEHGSRTNDIAYRVATRGGVEQRTLCPLFSQGVVGRTTSESYDTITTVTYALRAVAYTARHANDEA